MAWNDEIRSKIKRKAKSTAKREVKKEIKKISVDAWVCILLFLAVGIFAGGFTYSQLSKNDVFEVIGEKNIVLNVGDNYTYVEEGVKIVSLGKDISDKVKITTNIPEDGKIDTSSSANEYYVIYKVDDIKFGHIQKVRLIIIQEVQNG